MCLIWGVKIIKTFLNTGICIAFATSFTACAPKFRVGNRTPPPGTMHTDYSDLSNWAAHPGKTDFSDSVPLPLRESYSRDTTVDVFFIHPTTYTRKKPDSWNALLNDEQLNRKTDERPILYQASVFNRYNVYAPRYRQAHIYSYYTTDTLRAKAALEMAYADLRNAFEYYLEHENKGRPLVIASHSQGTTHAKRLIRELVEGTPLAARLVAAYLIGIQVEPGYFSSLEPCRDAAQYSCFLAWRTFRNGFEPDYAAPARSSVVTNPLSWTTDTLLAPRYLHKGAILYNFNRMFEAVSDVRIYKDLLWISWPQFPGSRWFRSKNYHIGDINLFYRNIRDNVDLRVDSYRKKTR